MAFSILRELLICTIVLLVPLYLIIKRQQSRKNPSLPTDWPLVGMLPGLIANRHNFHDFAAAMLAASGHSFRLRGPPGSSMQFFTTCDPANIRHIFTTNFDNYPKGEDLAEVFGVLAGTIIAADGESWRRQRARIQFVLTRPELLALMARTCRDKVADGLLPWLTRMAGTGAPFDIDDLFGRLLIDLTVTVVFGVDPCYLSADMPPMDVAAALDTLMEVVVYRHGMPALCWKLMRRLNVGPERKYAAAEALLRRFTEEKIDRRMSDGDDPAAGEAAAVDMLSHYINDPEYRTEEGEPTDFLHRTFINFLVAFRDPLSSALPWLVYNLATHPHAVSAVRNELAPVAASKSARGGGGGGAVIFDTEETKDLVYQRAALFESLRLYPIGPLERKEAVADDVLPSGHRVHAGDTVMVSFYAVGRMEGLWGQDCFEYRPERWILEDGSKLRHVPSYKFVSFNTGPRSCLGKKIAIAHLTSIVATLLWNFDVEVLESHAVEPKLSVVLQMKNGLMVKVKKRNNTTE